MIALVLVLKLAELDVETIVQAVAQKTALLDVQMIVLDSALLDVLIPAVKTAEEPVEVLVEQAALMNVVKAALDSVPLVAATLVQ